MRVEQNGLPASDIVQSVSWCGFCAQGSGQVNLYGSVMATVLVGACVSHRRGGLLSSTLTHTGYGAAW